MKDRVNLLDINFKSLPMEEKRTAFVLMDIMLKKLHEKNMMVTSFQPHDIYFENGFYSFEKVSPITNYYAKDKEEAILRNLLGLSNLAFCSYLSDYRLEQGLLSYEVVSNHFQSFANIFNEEDRNYYKTILVDCYQSGKLSQNCVYYSDYIINVNKGKNTSSRNSLSYVKATEAGRAMASEDEAAFGHTFFLFTVVASISVAFIGFILIIYTRFF